MSITNFDTSFTKDQINKIGNAIAFLANNIADLNKTKILKILFLIEEYSIKTYGYPFFGIDFQIWKLGPVAKDIFIDLSLDSPNLLKDYIQRSEAAPANFVSTHAFDDAEFSDNDINILEKVTEFAKGKTANELVKYTHLHNSLWRQSAIKNGVLELLENELINSTEHTIDFAMIFENDPEKLSLYNSFRHDNEIIRQLKS